MFNSLQINHGLWYQQEPFPTVTSNLLNTCCSVPVAQSYDLPEITFLFEHFDDYQVASDKVELMIFQGSFQNKQTIVNSTIQIYWNTIFECRNLFLRALLGSHSHGNERFFPFGEKSTKYWMFINKHSLKWKWFNFDEIFNIDCTRIGRNNTFQCRHWWIFHQNGELSVSVLFYRFLSWWCHQMETFSALLRLNKRLSTQSVIWDAIAFIMTSLYNVLQILFPWHTAPSQSDVWLNSCH